MCVLISYIRTSMSSEEDDKNVMKNHDSYPCFKHFCSSKMDFCFLFHPFVVTHKVNYECTEVSGFVNTQTC